MMMNSWRNKFFVFFKDYWKNATLCLIQNNFLQICYHLLFLSLFLIIHFKKSQVPILQWVPNSLLICFSIYLFPSLSMPYKMFLKLTLDFKLPVLLDKKLAIKIRKKKKKRNKILKAKNKTTRKSKKKNKNLKGNFQLCNKLKKQRQLLYKINKEFLKKERLIL